MNFLFKFIYKHTLLLQRVPNRAQTNIMARVIVVAQRTVEASALLFAASELWRPGDEPLVLFHVAACLPPEASVLHSAPHTVYHVPSGLVDHQELIDKVTRAVRSR